MPSPEVVKELRETRELVSSIQELLAEMKSLSAENQELKMGRAKDKLKIMELTRSKRAGKETCNDCLYFSPVVDRRRGQCRRFPPMASASRAMEITSSDRDWWCGEWQPSVKETEE